MRYAAKLLKQARKSTHGPPGIFTMTIPTGGGKTLSSLAFALEHAVRHGKRRIVYAIPYTSIIEQTANIFRDIFEPLGDILVEHHSNTDADQFGKEKSWSRLATENWDAPLIVTTTVQLFESLYAAKTSRCRKLHNLVNSVIVIDETQLLPAEHLNPIRHVMQLLQRYYGVSFVLSTATPTGLDPQKDPFGRQLLEGMHSHEIVHRPERYYASLKRVEYDLPADFSNVFSWDDIRDQLVQHESMLCVVNTRKDARELFDKMPKGTYHLSALMCAEHRSTVIEQIRSGLKKDNSVRVISTQLIEAGVDLDFPVVYRALAGLDSIVQAAGRCNREGRPDPGQVVVFVPPSKTPPGLLSISTQTTVSLLTGFTGDIESPDTFKTYFNALFGEVKNTDQSGVLNKLQKDAESLQIQFRTAAQQFRIIDDRETVSVFVRYNKEVDQWLGLLAKQPERWILRKLQRYAVTIYRYQFDAMLHRGDLEEIAPGFYAQSGSGIYHDALGLQTEEPELTPYNTVI
jgi:CRISPR-associated endonuclease/helicase Cas3